MNKKILALSRDRGSMQAIAPVVAALAQADGVDVITVATRESLPVLGQLGLLASPLDEAGFGEDPQQCMQALFDACRPDLVLSGSGPARGRPPESPEQFAILESRRRGLPSVAVQDFWGMYVERFSRDGASLAEDLLPDRLCVLDRRALSELQAFGVPADRMAVTHNPWLDALVAQAEVPVPDAARAHPGAIRVVLASQPLSAMREVRNWPYDQFTLFEQLLAAMPAPAAGGGPSAIDVVPHPSEDLARWHDRLAAPRRPDVAVELHGGSTRELLRTADFLVTSHSTLAYEALYLGTPCISLRPADRPVMRLWIDDAGLSTEFRDAQALRDYLLRADPAAERRRVLALKRELGAAGLFFSDGGATARVQREVERLLSGGTTT
ncbi:hypothetical protein [Ramlibacter sp.]|uniref:hypothetical protein n=1 Tax=Ramlibacter sp. TaxID=1917967 RepID=UPI002D6E30C3|nr:hypothetical protein [Ramlibacter sp.]HYD75001.1 hypothetical protein [Ramlibacter sp.]